MISWWYFVFNVLSAFFNIQDCQIQQTSFKRLRQKPGYISVNKFNYFNATPYLIEYRSVSHCSSKCLEKEANGLKCPGFYVDKLSEQCLLVRNNLDFGNAFLQAASVGKYFYLRETTTSCPENFTFVKNQCYQLIPLKQTWSESQKICQRQDSHLVAINSQAENNLLGTFPVLFPNLTANCKLGSFFTFWTGGLRINLTSLTDIGWAVYPNHVHWTLNYTYWYSNNPNNYDGTEHCVHYYDQGIGWNDANCGMQLCPLCESDVWK